MTDESGYRRPDEHASKQVTSVRLTGVSNFRTSTLQNEETPSLSHRHEGNHAAVF